MVVKIQAHLVAGKRRDRTCRIAEDVMTGTTRQGPVANAQHEDIFQTVHKDLSR